MLRSQTQQPFVGVFDGELVNKVRDVVGEFVGELDGLIGWRITW